MRRRRKRSGKRKIKVWKKVVLILTVLIFVLAGSLFTAFLVLHWQGEKSLKTVPADSKSAKEAKETEYIRYNGKKYHYREDIINILCIGVDKDIPMEEKRDTGSLPCGCHFARESGYKAEHDENYCGAQRFHGACQGDGSCRKIRKDGYEAAGLSVRLWHNCRPEQQPDGGSGVETFI